MLSIYLKINKQVNWILPLKCNQLIIYKYATNTIILEIESNYEIFFAYQYIPKKSVNNVMDYNDWWRKNQA